VRAARDSHRARELRAGASASGNSANAFVYDASAASKPPLDIPHWHSRALVNDGRVFTETFPVRFDECGPNKRSTMRTVASMIQECACNHAQGIWGRAQSMPADMNKANLAWVCTRLHIDVHQYPLWGDQVEVKTWFEAQGKIAARRDWEMTDVTDGTPNKVIARATSSWIAFNLEKRKLARIPQTVIDEFQVQALPGAPVMGFDYEIEKLPDVRGMPGVTIPESHSVRRTDLDMNNHVNNVVYTGVAPGIRPRRVLGEVRLEGDHPRVPQRVPRRGQRGCHLLPRVRALRRAQLRGEARRGAARAHAAQAGIRHVPAGSRGGESAIRLAREEVKMRRRRRSRVERRETFFQAGEAKNRATRASPREAPPFGGHETFFEI
jgi:fatty acyl-ACP thioesterase A